MLPKTSLPDATFTFPIRINERPSVRGTACTKRIVIALNAIGKVIIAQW